MNRHHVFRQRVQQILEQSPLSNFQVAVAIHLIELRQDDRLPHPACSIGCDKWVGFRGQHRARLNGFFVIIPVVPKAGQKKQTAVDGVTRLATTSKRLVETVPHQDTPLRLECVPESPRRVNGLTAGIKSFPLVLLSRRILFRQLPVGRQPAPLPEFDDPLIRVRIPPDDGDFLHGIKVFIRQRIDVDPQTVEQVDNLMQVRFGVVSVAHADTLTARISLGHSLRRNMPSLRRRPNA